MRKRHVAQLVLAGRGKRRIVTAYEAMSPEVLRTARGASVTLSMRGGTLLLRFEADTVPALRALVNSHLRWLSMIEETLNVVEHRSDG